MKPKLKSTRKKTGPKPGTINPRAHGAGRKKGTPNFITKDVREAVIEAVTLIGGRQGMVGYFRKLHHKKPELLAGIVSRLIPASVTVKNDLSARMLELLQQSDNRPMIDVTPKRLGAISHDKPE